MPIQYICQHCATAFLVPPSRHPRFCSLTCARRHGRPSITERLWASTDQSDPSGCWLWTGSISTSGYGYLHIGHSFKKATHRLAWEMVAGPIPDDLWVLHTCDVRACARNDDEGVYLLNGEGHPRRGHLWLGTRTDNLRDMAAKGRSANQIHPDNVRGERNPHAKLTDHQVATIRQRHAVGDITQQALSVEFKVTNAYISKLIARQNRR